MRKRFSCIHVHALTYDFFFFLLVPPPAIRKAGEDIINPIQSARIRTINSFSFTYGTVEIRAKMPRGDWIWPGTSFNKESHFKTHEHLRLY